MFNVHLDDLPNFSFTNADPLIVDRIDPVDPVDPVDPRE